jgi:hypothetical protein
MSRYIGNYLRVPSSEPQQSSAPGIWSLSDQLAYQRANVWPPARDPYYNQTVLHLSGDVAGTKETNPVTQSRTFLSDASTNNFLLTPNGDVSARPFSPYGTSWSTYFVPTANASTAGSNFSIASPTPGLSFGTNDFTVECWVNKTKAQNVLILDTRSGITATPWAFCIDGSNCPYFYDGTSYTSTVPITLNQWTHIAVTRASGTLRIFVNGIQGYSATVTTNLDRTAGAIIGAKVVTPDNAFDGYLSSLRVVKGQALYTTTFTPSTAPLTTTSQGAIASNVSLLAFQSNRFIDLTNNFTLTPSNSPSISQNSPFVEYETTSGSGYFNGSTGYLTWPGSAIGTSPFCFECWFYPTSIGTVQTLFGNNSTSSGSISVRLITSTRIDIDRYNVASSQFTVPTMAANQWYHLVACRDASNNTTIFLNGVRSSTGTISDSYNYGNVASVGYLNSAFPQMFGGNIAAARLVVGSTPYDPTQTTITIPTAPLTPVSGTQLLTLQTRAPANNQGILDSSPNRFVVTRTGNVAQGSFSPFSAGGWSNLFNGSNGFTVPSGNANFSFAGEFTWEAFVNFNALPASGGAFGIAVARGSVASNSGFQFLLNNVSGSYVVTATISIGSTDYGPNWNVPAPSLGVWYHVAIVRDSANNMRCYWDGTLRSLSSGPSSVSGTLNTPAGVVSVGYRGNGYNDLYYNGYISNLRMIATAMYSGSNIQIPTAPFSPTVPNTRFLTCQSNRFLETGSNMAITPISSPSVQPFSPFAPTQAYVASQIGGSLRVSASGDIISWPQNTWNNRFSSNNWSIEAWVYPTASTSTDFFVDQWTNGTTTTSLIFTFMGGNFDIYIGSTLYTLTGITPTLNAWTHIVAVRTGGTFSVFQNGVRTHTRSDLGTGVVNNGGTANRASPGFGGGAGCFFHGHRIVIGSNVPYDATNTIISIPTAPVTAISGTASLLLGTGAGIVDNTGRNVVETVGNVHITTSGNVPVNGTTGILVFDGTGDFLKMPYNELFNIGSGDYTVEAWIYPTQHGEIIGAFNLNGPNYPGWLLSTNFGPGGVGKLSTFFANTSASQSSIYSSTSVSLNAWSHVVFTKQSTTIRLFINGNLDTTGNLTLVPSGSNQQIHIGADSNSLTSPTRNFGGYIDDLRITKGYARYAVGTGNTMIFAGTTAPALPTKPFSIG